jgi:PAS domain S-box-containing protein
MTDRQMTLTFVRGPLLRLLRLEPERLLGRTLPALLLNGREDHPFIQAHITALGGYEATVRIEWGGSLYHARIAPLRDAAGAIVGCAGVHQEIGWVPDDEGTLRESDIRLRRVVDSNMIGIAFGNEDGHITDANEAFLQLAGYTREDLVPDGISWPSLTPIEAHPRQLQALEELRRDGRCRPFEVELIRKDGDRVPVLVGAARLSAQRRDGVAFVLDISERKRIFTRMQAELACADVLAEAASLDGPTTDTILDSLGQMLRWKIGALWTLTEDGQLRLHGMRGMEPAYEPMIGEIAMRVAAAPRAIWTAESETFATPLTAGGRNHGALVLIGRLNGERDTELIQACQRIANRVARFLARRSAHSTGQQPVTDSR